MMIEISQNRSRLDSYLGFEDVNLRMVFRFIVQTQTTAVTLNLHV